MDFSGYSTVGTQTPTEERSFKFPDSFGSTRSSVSLANSSIGTPPGSRFRPSLESPEAFGSSAPARPRPKLFRRHSTGSDVYNFSAISSPTLATACGGVPFGNRGFSSKPLMCLDEHQDHHNSQLCSTSEGIESVGQQLRQIGDDLDRGGRFRSRSLSLSRFLVNVHRRTYRSSSSSP